jgi:hypothetical protein
MTCVLILILRTGTDPLENRNVRRLWALLGISAGIGFLNKPSMLFFLIAVLGALLVTPQRRILASRWVAVAVALTVLITLPYVFWQAHNHWPTPQFLINARIAHPELRLSHRTFVHVQINDMGTLLFPLWGAGLIRLLRRSNERWLGLVFVFFFLGMMAIRAKDYYVTPIYPILFAAGGVAWESYFSHRHRVAGDRVFAFPAYQAVIIAYGLITLPLALPILPPAKWIAYTNAMHLYRPSPFLLKFIGPLPPFFADRFGWQEEVDEVARIYKSLPRDQQEITGILCSNYGEASAINFLGRGLPVAISPRNNYYLWGTNGYTGDSMIVIADLPREKLLQYFNSVEVAGYMTAPYSMAYEHQNVYLATGRKFEMAQLWPTLKAYF